MKIISIIIWYVVISYEMCLLCYMYCSLATAYAETMWSVKQERSTSQLSQECVLCSSVLPSSFLQGSLARLVSTENTSPFSAFLELRNSQDVCSVVDTSCRKTPKKKNRMWCGSWQSEERPFFHTLLTFNYLQFVFEFPLHFLLQ